MVTVASIVLFASSLVLYGAALFLPANDDWLGFFWAAFAVEATARGPRVTPDYALFVIVTAANTCFLLAPLAFPFARSLSAKLLPHLLVIAAAASVWARFQYRAQTWAIGFDVWCAALAIMAFALYLRAYGPLPKAAARTSPLALVGRPPGAARDVSRRTSAR